MEGLPGDPVRGRRPHPRRRAAVGLSAPRRLILLRHGQTAHNVDGRIQGQLDVDLDEVGRAQAAAVADVLAQAAPYAVISSDLARARETAEPVAALSGVPLRLDPRLRELHLGEWQGLTGAEARERFPDEHAAWVAGHDVPRGGGETYRDGGERAHACLTELLDEAPEGATVIAVSHGGTLRATIGRLLEIDPADWWRFSVLGNTCWSVLVQADRGWRLERHNAGLGPLIGPATGVRELPDRLVGSPDAEPVK